MIVPVSVCICLIHEPCMEPFSRDAVTVSFVISYLIKNHPMVIWGGMCINFFISGSPQQNYDKKDPANQVLVL